MRCATSLSVRPDENFAPERRLAVSLRAPTASVQTGVGNNLSSATSWTLTEWPPARRLAGSWLPPLSPMFAVGVGSRSITAAGSGLSPFEPRMFGPPFGPSLARGVGSSRPPVSSNPFSAMIARSVTISRPGFFRKCSSGVLPEGCATGVGKHEYSCPPVARPDVGGA